MRWLAAIVSVIALGTLALIIAWVVMINQAATRSDHFDDPILGYLRNNQDAGARTDMIPAIFKSGIRRIVVTERLRESGFVPAKGTVFDRAVAPGLERWINRQETTALWHFSVEVGFDPQGRLVEAVGSVYGPTFK